MAKHGPAAFTSSAVPAVLFIRPEKVHGLGQSRSEFGHCDWLGGRGRGGDLFGNKGSIAS
jgi:hypothetical protein